MRTRGDELFHSAYQRRLIIRVSKGCDIERRTDHGVVEGLGKRHSLDDSSSLQSWGGTKWNGQKGGKTQKKNNHMNVNKLGEVGQEVGVPDGVEIKLSSLA